MGGALAKLVRAALASCVDALPEQPGPHDLYRLRLHVETVAVLLGKVLSERLRSMLMAAAEREHWLTTVELTRAANGRRRESASDLLAAHLHARDAARGVRHPGSNVISEGWRDYINLILPAPARDFLERIVGPLWRRIVGSIAPERASNAVLQGVASGKNRKEIAADLEDVFGGYESAARRVARTAGLQVATQTQIAVSEQIPELVAGYELNTVLDDRVRPEHRAMHGRKFYRVPNRGQRGLDQCPQPPIWNGQVAWNCRCFLIPILVVDGEEV